MSEFLMFLKRHYPQFFVNVNVLVLNCSASSAGSFPLSLFSKSNVVESWGDHQLLLQQPFYERFDVVVCNEPALSDALFHQIMRTVKPSGMFVYVHTTPWQQPKLWDKYFAASQTTETPNTVFAVGFLRCLEQHIDRSIHLPRERFEINTLPSL